MEKIKNFSKTLSDSAGHEMAELVECFDHERLADLNEAITEAREAQRMARLPAYVMHG